MNNFGFDPQRRGLLKAGVGLFALGGLTVNLQAHSQEALDNASLKQGQFDPGKPGDFDFLAGDWKIRNRKRKAEGKDDWDEFDGESTCWTVLAGVGSIEELRIPARDFSGIGIRMLDVEKKVWSDFWVNGKSGVLTAPGTTGGFVNGVGTFISEWTEAGQTVQAKGVWDQITPQSCRWYQAISRDGGATWEENWIMHWERKSKS